MNKPSANFLCALPQQEHRYYQTYFHIDAGYVWGDGMDASTKANFFADMTAVFSKAGWEVEDPRGLSSCPTVHKGDSHLYCHPMQLSGPCERSLVDEVVSILSSAKTCTLRNVAIHDQVYDLTDVQYKNALDTVQADIEADIIAAFTTSRKDKYLSDSNSQIYNIANRYHIRTLDKNYGIRSDDIHIKYVEARFNDMVERGAIIRYADPVRGVMYRSATQMDRLMQDSEQLSQPPVKISFADRLRDAQVRAKAQQENQNIPRTQPGISYTRG